jgi:hypothetical protein
MNKTILLSERNLERSLILKVILRARKFSPFFFLPLFSALLLSIHKDEDGVLVEERWVKGSSI